MVRRSKSPLLQLLLLPAVAQLLLWQLRMMLTITVGTFLHWQAGALALELADHGQATLLLQLTLEAGRLQQITWAYKAALHWLCTCRSTSTATAQSIFWTSFISSAHT